MIRHLLPLFFLATIIACDHSQQAQEEEVLSDVEVIEEEVTDSVIETIEEEIKQEEVTGFQSTTARMMQNQHDFSLTISDNYGVYVITQPGAMPKVEHVYELEVTKFSSEVLFEELPKVICENTIYDKQGCFAQEKNPLTDSQIWNYAGMHEKEKQAVIAQVETIKYTVIDTRNKIIYYFSEIEGEWYLTFVDLRVPCEA